MPTAVSALFVHITDKLVYTPAKLCAWKTSTASYNTVINQTDHSLVLSREMGRYCYQRAFLGDFMDRL